MPDTLHRTLFLLPGLVGSLLLAACTAATPADLLPAGTPAAGATAAIRLNQLGYTPNAPKIAVIVHDASQPLTWTLLDAGTAAVAEGQTTVFGRDKASGEHLHQADFTAVTAPGDGYVLQVAGASSHPFRIDATLYAPLARDAMAYFYHNRSGIEIAMPFAGEEQWTRPAGHVGVAPNQGDTAVTCFKGVDQNGKRWEGCDYTLDVSGGWYDAGDHGKYVVNGGISVWTLLNLYERARWRGLAPPFPDGSLNIPEAGNGVDDLLDEVRWQMEFMLSMQVPPGGVVEGRLLEGMVHHKVHDQSWTGLGMAPDRDPQPRALYPPSTAATLNLAATAAQCARIWADIDPAFAGRCLEAAETAWQAALAHPDEFAADNFNGGGPYGDRELSDEFYWAAAELFITTGQDTYRTAVVASPHFMQAGDFAWPQTAAPGTMSLLVTPNALPDADLQHGRERLIATADRHLATLAAEGYRLPLAPGDYVWGSNSDVLNRLILFGLAYDLTGERRYLDGVSEGMDYILGRNALDQSYVTGYGARPLQNPHHRFWARQHNRAFPPPPPGAVSGGPNPDLQDPLAQAELAGCAPQKCQIDHIDSWSTNEITINWNAPLAWVAAFLSGS